MGNQKGKKNIYIIHKDCQILEEYIAVLVRLRLGLLLEDVADRFRVSCSTLSRGFNVWITVMAGEMKVIFPWPSRQQVQLATPKQFLPYPNTRVIIDHLLRLPSTNVPA